jgi:MSHA biogenesis protein MshL
MGDLFLLPENVTSNLSRLLLCSGMAAMLVSCSASLPLNAPGRHLENADAPEVTEPSSIPGIVTPAPLLPVPAPEEIPELFTVVAQDIPLRELLFEIARDAAINVDIHPQVSGSISINAIEQTLPQILTRLSRQADIRWMFDESGNLIVEPDSPFWRTYRVDYVNVVRTASTSAQVSNAINSNVGGAAGGGGGGGAGAGGINNSTSSLSQTTTNNFWATLTANLTTLLADTAASGATGADGADGADAGATQDAADNVVTNQESGVVTVRATARQHEEIAAFLNNVQSRALSQVLIEATVVEVTLSDNFQQGVDWATLSRDSGRLNVVQNSLGANLNEAQGNVLMIDRGNTPDAITATIAMLSRFGELRVLSSPKIMTLNNQPAILRAVDNKVYFTVEVQPGTPATPTTAPTPPVYTTSVNTIPEGFVMTVTPQIGDGDQVTLNVRPTITRIVRYVDDPNPILAETGVTNSIPESHVSELESVLKVFSGQVAILGGLMQDSVSRDVDGLPGLSRMPFVRNLFSYRAEVSSKTELIVFIRPVVIRQPSINGDLEDFRQYLPSGDITEESAAILPLPFSR